MVQTKEEKRQKKRDYDKKRYPKIKEQKKEYDKEYNKINSVRISVRNKKYRSDNKDKIKQWKRENYEENKEEILKKNKTRRTALKIQAFNILGGCKCSLCGEEKFEYLTIDHINEKGYLERPNRQFNGKIYNKIIKKEYSKKELLDLRVLCYNCNCSRPREYLNFIYEKQTKPQKYQTKIWKQAYEFFGPCKSCGDSDLTHLTISHIHNDGAERRKNGEKTGVQLLKKFRQQGWPESLKENYCFECYNCNCSKRLINLDQNFKYLKNKI